MPGYVIEYDRLTGEAHVTPFEQPGGHRLALKYRLKLESERTSNDIEIVSLVSDSIETVKRTHSRYFGRLPAHA